MAWLLQQMAPITDNTLQVWKVGSGGGGGDGDGDGGGGGGGGGVS